MSKNRPTENELRERIKALSTALSAAKNALLSYQYGNSSPELAKEVVEHIQKILQDERKEQ